jgi:hypothetical protein
MDTEGTDGYPVLLQPYQSLHKCFEMQEQGVISVNKEMRRQPAKWLVNGVLENQLDISETPQTGKTFS